MTMSKDLSVKTSKACQCQVTALYSVVSETRKKGGTVFREENVFCALFLLLRRVVALGSAQKGMPLREPAIPYKPIRGGERESERGNARGKSMME
jgi:hypothetical protein